MLFGVNTPGDPWNVADPPQRAEEGAGAAPKLAPKRKIVKPIYICNESWNRK